MLDRETIENAIAEHKEAPHMRTLQKLLAKEITVMVHGEEEFNKAIEASNMLFGNSTQEALKKLDEQTFLSVFDGVPQFEVSREKLGTNIIDMLAVESSIFPSKGECRKMIQANGLSINKEKFTAVDGVLAEDQLINDKYILVQKGKKNYFILKFN